MARTSVRKLKQQASLALRGGDFNELITERIGHRFQIRDRDALGDRRSKAVFDEHRDAAFAPARIEMDLASICLDDAPAAQSLAELGHVLASPHPESAMGAGAALGIRGARTSTAITTSWTGRSGGAGVGRCCR